jgi:hypothetical protein
VQVGVEVGEEGFNLDRAHVFRVVFWVEEDKALDSMEVAFLSFVGVVFEAEIMAH